jgi:hypothetical protein
MSALSEALSAIKSIILIEERVKSQGTKLEKLAELLVDVDRRLVRVETTLDLATRGAVQSRGLLAVPHTQSGRDEPT